MSIKSRVRRSKYWHTIKPGLAWPQSLPGLNFDLYFGLNPKFGLASKICLASNLASKIFLATFFFQNSDLFRVVLIMISMIDWLFVWFFIKLYLNDCEFFHDLFFVQFAIDQLINNIYITDCCLIFVLISIHSNTYTYTFFKNQM